MMAKAARARRKPRKQTRPMRIPGRLFGVLAIAAFLAGVGGVALQAAYSVSWQSPLRVRLQWPLVVTPRTSGAETAEAQADQLGHRLTAYQQYACNKFG